VAIKHSLGGGYLIHNMAINFQSTGGCEIEQSLGESIHFMQKTMFLYSKEV